MLILSFETLPDTLHESWSLATRRSWVRSPRWPYIFLHFSLTTTTCSRPSPSQVHVVVYQCTWHYRKQTHQRHSRLCKDKQRYMAHLQATPVCHSIHILRESDGDRFPSQCVRRVVGSSDLPRLGSERMFCPDGVVYTYYALYQHFCTFCTQAHP